MRAVSKHNVPTPRAIKHNQRGEAGSPEEHSKIPIRTRPCRSKDREGERTGKGTKPRRGDPALRGAAEKTKGKSRPTKDSQRRGTRKIPNGRVAIRLNPTIKENTDKKRMLCASILLTAGLAPVLFFVPGVYRFMMRQ